MTIPEERLDRLESLAACAARTGENALAREYVRLARRIAERQRLTFPRTFDRHICPKCDVYLRPGKNARVRLQDGHVIITCDCGGQSRYGYETTDNR